MFCTQCGTKLDGRAKFCPQCGTLQPGANPSPSLPVLDHLGSGSSSDRPTVEPAATYLLEEGTAVVLSFSETVSSETAAVGDRINLSLDEELRVGDLVFAKRGAKAVATVSHVKKAGMLGRAGELNLRVEYVKVGATRVPLRASQGAAGASKGHANMMFSAVLWGAFALMRRGKNVAVPAGTRCVAFVDEDVRLPAEFSPVRLTSEQAKEKSVIESFRPFLRYVLINRPWVFPAFVAALLLLMLLIIAFQRVQSRGAVRPEQGTAAGAGAGKQTASSRNPSISNGPPVARPSIPRPQFRIYHQAAEMPTAVVVSPTTTDDQLRSLLWFFREKVKTGKYQDLGLKPTSKRWGELGYEAGLLTVFRGQRCASEVNLLEDRNPCGYGEHWDATYWWGVENDPQKDVGEIRRSNGDIIRVFGYEDGWRPPQSPSLK